MTEKELKLLIRFYILAIHYQMRHDSISFAWKGKVEPHVLKQLEFFRQEMFDTCKLTRETLEMSAEEIKENDCGYGDFLLKYLTVIEQERTKTKWEIRKEKLKQRLYKFKCIFRKKGIHDDWKLFSN